MRNETEHSPTPRPNIQDIILIDGKRAQVVASDTIVFLESGNHEHIDWDSCAFYDELPGTTVGDIESKQPGSFTEKEIKNIHWGELQTKDLKSLVIVAGEYFRKPK